jgi:molecular chaperone GrpE
MADQDDERDANTQMRSNDANDGGEDDLMKKVKKLKKKEGKKVHEAYQLEIEELKQAKEEADGKALRALAELQNAQKRMETEKASFAAFAAQSLVLQVLEIYENYHRLMQHKPEGLPDDEWHKGLELIDQQFGGFLQQQGVSQIEVKLGDSINPEKHEAMMTGEGEAGIILEVFSPGWEMKGRVIKAAKVKVGK